MGLLTMLMGASAFGVKVQADENPGDFGVKAILPRNQIDPAISYFDLLEKPGGNQKLTFTVTNATKKRRTFDVNVNPAVTSDGGTIDYSQQQPDLDASLPFDPRQIMQLDRTSVSLNAGETKQFAIQLKVPPKPFFGKVLAGIHVQPRTAQPKTALKKAKPGARIINRYAYNLAIVLQESQASVTPDLKLLAVNTYAVNAHPTVQLRFQNPTPTIIGELVFNTKLYQNGKLMLTDRSNPYLVAPNTHFHLNLALGDQRATAGHYRVVIHAKAKGGHKWTFARSFTVSQKRADRVNHHSVFTKPERSFGQLAIVLAVLLVLALLVIILLLARKPQNKSFK